MSNGRVNDKARLARTLRVPKAGTGGNADTDRSRAIHPAPKPKKSPRRKARSGGRLFAGTRDDAYCAWIRSLPCAICEIWPFRLGGFCSGAVMGEFRQQFPTEVEHHVAKSHGGKDRGDTFPTCGGHREMKTAMGPRTFERWAFGLGLDLTALCRRLAEIYEDGYTPREATELLGRRLVQQYESESPNEG